ncbi:MAG: MlaA family lipoprotein, partial [Alphaproteobacteria bacterium]
MMRFFVCVFLLCNLFCSQKILSNSPKGIDDVFKEEETPDWWIGEESDIKDILNCPDPLEPINRAIFDINRVFDGLIFKPISILYDTTIHDDAKKGIRNVIDNFFAPLSCVNHILQGKGKKTAETFFRFLLNSTFGVLGIFDVASHLGLKKNETSFEETLACYGAGTGPYLVLPILGSSSFRGIVGKGGDFGLNPLYHISQNYNYKGNKHNQQRYLFYALYGMDMIDKRARLIDALN